MGLTQVSTDGVKDDAIDASKLPANSVGASELADNSVDSAALSADCVIGSKIADQQIATEHIADQAVALSKLPHGDGSSDGKFLRANNGADPTFETVNTDLVSDTSPQLGGDLQTNGNHIGFADNNKARFGSGNDLDIYHNGTDSYIDNGTGDFYIRGVDEKWLYIQAKSGENSILCKDDGGVELYFDNTKKFETASGGVSLTGGAAANITALSDGATINIDMSTACHHSVTLGGNRTFAAPSNQVIGQSGSLFITQDGSGSRTASFNSAFKFVGGTAPTLTTTASAVDRIDYVILSSNVIHCAVSLDVK